MKMIDGVKNFYENIGKSIYKQLFLISSIFTVFIIFFVSMIYFIKLRNGCITGIVN